MKRTQNERVLDYIRARPGCTAMEIAHGCSPWISNPRARISDLRAAGFEIAPVKRKDGATGFVVREPVAVTRGEAVPLW